METGQNLDTRHEASQDAHLVLNRDSPQAVARPTDSKQQTDRKAGGRAKTVKSALLVGFSEPLPRTKQSAYVGLGLDNHKIWEGVVD